MPQYKLKVNVPDFEVVDGKFEGRKFKAGETYAEIPAEEKEKFEVIKEARPAPAAIAKEAASSPAAELKDEGGKKS